jgi:phage terminase small subunit
MADGLTPKQEAFCRGYLETGNATEAYRRAYDVDPNSRDSWLHVEACQLLGSPKITRRVEELQDEAARLSIYTVMKASQEYEDARALAMDAGNPAAAVSAISGKVKLFGLERPKGVSFQLGEHTEGEAVFRWKS